MNKDFEKEYKEFTEIEAPDLWDRIEAGITEKEIPEETAPDTEKQKKVLSFVKRYSPLAAALLCAVIVIPALSLMRQSGQKGSFSGSAADMNAAPAAGDTCATEESEEGYEMTEETYEEESAEEAAQEPSENDAASFSGASGDEAMSGAAESESKEALTENAPLKDMMADSGVSMTDEEESRGEAKKEKQELSNIAVKITDVENYLDKDSPLDESGTIYTAIVEKDPSGTLTEGEQIEIFIPAYSSLALVKDEVFELNLAYAAEEENLFTIVR